MLQGGKPLPLCSETRNAKRETPNAKRYLRSSQITPGPRIDSDGFALFDKEWDLD